MILVGKKNKSGEEGMQLQLGKYEIGKTLGEGNFGKVKYAKDVQTGHSFAVKILEKTRIKNLNFSDQVCTSLHVYVTISIYVSECVFNQS